MHSPLHHLMLARTLDAGPRAHVRGRSGRRPGGRRILVALALVLATLGAVRVADAAVPRKLGVALDRLQHDVAGQRGKLGSRAGSRLSRAARRAYLAAVGGRPCRALEQLSRLVNHSKRLKPGLKRDLAAGLAARARKLQRRLIRLKAVRRNSCGLAKPKLRVRPGIDPALASLPPLGGARRPLARIEDAHGNGGDYVADELVVRGSSDRALHALLARWHGRVLRTADPGAGKRKLRLVRIDAAGVDVDGLAHDLRKVDATSHGRYGVSSAAGMRLLAAALEEAAHGLEVGVNWVDSADQFVDRATTEGPSGPGMAPGDPGFMNYGRNPFSWWYMRRDTPGLGAAEAWRALEIAANGKPLNRVRIAVIDQGFRPNPDLSSGSTGADNTPGTMKCGGNDCPWHGTGVAAAAAAVPDNQIGVAGAAGPVADVTMVWHDGTAFGDAAALFEAIEAGARVVNMSFGASAPFVDWSFSTLESATKLARKIGVLVVAAAGNDGVDVDAETCIGIGCIEDTVHAPCELNGVLCVGGVKRPSDSAHPDSNYGYESCGSNVCDVDIFGPWGVFAPSSGDGTTTTVFGGTSSSAPYVAGVAALVMSANPALTANEVSGILLTTALPTVYAKVGRVVNAYLAVWLALGNTDWAPYVKILTPERGSTWGYGGLNSVTFTAEVGDIEDPVCCSVHWTSSLDSGLGTGNAFESVFASAGLRYIEARVKDSAGNEAKDWTLVEAVNSPPTVTIDKPLAGATPARGSKFRFEGTSFDAQEAGPLPCTSLKWTLRDLEIRGAPVESVHNGCHPLATLAKAGDKLLTLTATDADSVTVNKDVQFTVVEPPPHSPPSVWIEQPDTGDTFPNVGNITLKGDAIDPDNGPVTLTWTIKPVGEKEKTIGTGKQVVWNPNDSNVSCADATLRLSATDADGTSVDSVKVRIWHDSLCVS